MPFAPLVLECSLIFLTCLASGWLPLALPLSARHLRLVSVLGMGVLMGSAFAVIIPEGVDQIYRHALTDTQADTLSGASSWSLADWWNITLSDTDTVAAPLSPPHTDHGHEHPGTSNRSTKKRLLGVNDSAVTGAHITARFSLQSAEAHSHDHNHDHGAESGATCNSEPDGSGQIGAALVLGFAVMLVVDRVTTALADRESARASEHRTDVCAADSPAQSPWSEQSMRDVPTEDDSVAEMEADADVVQRTNFHHVANSPQLGALSAANTVASLARQTAHPSDRERTRVEREKARERLHGYQSYGAVHHPSTTNEHNTAVRATMGLMVYSAVDGVALGSVAVTAASSMALLSLVLHHAPAAFGLVSYLMHQNTPVRQIKWQLLSFSLLAPLTAMVTYGLQRSGVVGALSVRPATLGLCLLFSGGAFLFTVAVHVMPALAHTPTSTAPRAKRKGGEDEVADTAERESLLSSPQPNHGHNHHAAHAHTPAHSLHREPSACHSHSHGHSHSSLIADTPADSDGEPLDWHYVLTLAAGICAPLVAAVVIDALDTNDV